MHVYVWEHIVSLSYRTAWWMCTNLVRDEMLMTPAHVLWCIGHICTGADPLRGKNMSWGSLSSKKLLLQTGRLQQQTECIAHVDWSVVGCSSNPKSNFWRAHCTQVSYSGPLGLFLFLLGFIYLLVFILVILGDPLFICA